MHGNIGKYREIQGNPGKLREIQENSWKLMWKQVLVSKTWEVQLAACLLVWANENVSAQKAVNHSCWLNFGRGMAEGFVILQWDLHLRLVESCWGRQGRGNCGSKFTCERDPGAVCIRVLIRQYSWSRLQSWLKPDLKESWVGLY